MHHLGSGYNWPDACEIQSPESSCEHGVYLLLWGHVTCSGGLLFFILVRTEGESVFKAA